MGNSKQGSQVPRHMQNIYSLESCPSNKRLFTPSDLEAMNSLSLDNREEFKDRNTHLKVND